MHARLAATALAAATALVPVSASASPTDADRCSRETPEFCLNGVSSSVTALDSLRVTGQKGTTERRSEDDDTRASIGAGRLGGAAGDGLSGVGVWGSAGRISFESDVRVAPYEADADSLFVGVDRLFGDRLVVGVALGYERADSETRFNGGGQDTDGFNVAPYAAFIVNDAVSLDASIGYGALDTDQDRIDPANGATLSSSFSADRFFMTANVNALHISGAWVLGGRAGYLYTAESQDAYTEVGGPSVRSVRSKHLDLGQVYVGADIGYSTGAWEPYAVGFYRNDLGRDDGSGAGGLPSAVGSTQPEDDDEFQVGAGLRYFGRDGVSGTFEWLTTQGRENFEDHSFNLTVRVDIE